MTKSKSIRLSLYLAARARGDRRSDTVDAIAAERLGHASDARPDGPLIWFHTGRDATARAARELAKRLSGERAGLSFLFTTVARERCRSWSNHLSQIVPDEMVPATRRFLDHWSPQMAVWTEMDLRPALLHEAHSRKIPLLMLDTGTARKPEIQSWSRSISRDVLDLFQTIIAGNGQSEALLRQMGARADKIETLGFLQEGTPAPPCSAAERDDLAGQLAGRPTWLAISVTDKERMLVLDAHRAAQRKSHRLLLILVPMVPGDGPRWARELTEAGFHVALRSFGEEPAPETQIYVADTEGEQGLWYRLAPISFLGRSLVGDETGIDPFSAASLGSAIIHGPHIDGHRATYERLLAAGAARPIRDAETLGEAVEALLSPARAADMAMQGWEVSSAGADVTDRVIDLILTEIEAR